MPASTDVSFYFFDFDDNIMFLKTTIYIRNTVTGEEKEVSTGEFALIQALLGRPGQWEDFGLFPDTFRNFRDLPANRLAAGQPQKFVMDVEAAVSAPEEEWKAPSWNLLVHACAAQRPVSIVTARGHTPDTIKAGIRALVARKLLPREPNYHTIYPVGNDAVRRELGDKDLTMTTPALKKLAIIQSVEEAIRKHGDAPAHRFGMSDDDPQNVDLIIKAMTVCKMKRPDKRFFVINTHFDQKVKLEIFPVDFPVTGRHATEAVDVSVI